MWQFARPYRGTIALFLAAILVAALLALVAAARRPRRSSTRDPRRRPQPRSGGWRRLAVGAALGDAGLQIVQRWCSARVGEGLIADLRRALFAKVQRLPLAFFTRTPTGAITSRLNNDVIGAQTAVTSTLGSVVSNVVVLVTTLVAMLALEWRLTLLALVVLPMFVIPARRVGRRLQDISREQMQHNAAMNTQMTERFNVVGRDRWSSCSASLDRENAMFGRRANAVRDAGIRSAMLGRVFFVALGLVAALGTAAIYGVGAQSSSTATSRRGTLVALAALVDARLPAAHRADQRAGRPDDVDGAASSGCSRCSTRPRRSTSGPARSTSSTPTGRVEFDDVMFRYPPASEIVDRVDGAARDPRRRPRSRRAPGRDR